MTTIPDEVVREMVDAACRADGHSINDISPANLKRSIRCMNAAAEVAVEWAREDQKDGYVVVPVEPTRKMLEAAEDAYTCGYTGTPTAVPAYVWKAMIDAIRNQKD